MNGTHLCSIARQFMIAIGVLTTATATVCAQGPYPGLPYAGPPYSEPPSQALPPQGLPSSTSHYLASPNLAPQWGQPLFRPLPDPDVVFESLEEIPVPAESSPAGDNDAGASGDGAQIDDPIVVGPEITPLPKLWDLSVELGLSGTNGNSETLNFRVGSHAKRKVPGNEFTIDLNYKRDSANSNETANRLFYEARQERLSKTSPWSCYLHSTVEYDEFKAFQIRIALDAGVGYTFFATDVSNLKGRLGSGASRELGGPDDSYVPDGLIGFEYDREVSEFQSIDAAIEYFPSWEDYAHYRVNARAGWEIILDEASNLSLRISGNSRYDSTPNGAKRNDLDYSTLLIWKY